MSDLSTAAEALNVPEDILQRSAAARATAEGTSTEEVLAAWAGGSPAPSGGASAPPADEPDTDETPTEDTATDSAPADTPAADAPAAEPTAQPAAATSPAPAPVAAAPATPPILEVDSQRPFLVMAGAAALFLVAIVAGLVVPALPGTVDAVYSSEQPMTQNAIDGKHLYTANGCAACHTQMVRPIAVDAGLGAVTLEDTNQVLGLRRLGPDLAHVGNRIEDPSTFREILTSVPGHPAYDGLSDDDLQRIASYLVASR